MSLIIFDRMMHYLPANEACETEEEVDDDDYNFNNADVDSKSYLVNLYKNLKNCNYFLNSLIVNEQLNYVVISLFKNHQFSFGIKLYGSDTVAERVHFTCEDAHIIDYIDNEELPPKLIEIIEMFNFDNIYYNGCIISEIRDYRQSSTEFYNSYFILLKPTSLSLYNDVKKIIGLTNRNFSWTNSARLKLESKLIYLTSPKLCLDPNSCIGILSKKLSRKKLIFGNKSFLRLPRKRLKRNVQQQQQQQEQQSIQFKLLKFLRTNRSANTETTTTAATANFLQKMKPNPIAIENQLKLLQNNEYKDVEMLAKSMTMETKDCQTYELIKMEEYRMEFLDSTAAIIILTVYRRPYDDVYFGSIVNIRNGDVKSAPNFYLGTKEMKRRYIEQFIETFSENGKKLIKITQRVGNEEPKVKHTQAVEMYLLRQQQQQQQQHHQQNMAKIKAERQQQSSIISINNKPINESIKVQNHHHHHQQQQTPPTPPPRQTIILNSIMNNHNIKSTSDNVSSSIVSTHPVESISSSATAKSSSSLSASSSSTIAINNNNSNNNINDTSSITKSTTITSNQIVITKNSKNFKFIQAANVNNNIKKEVFNNDGININNNNNNNNDHHSTSLISMNVQAINNSSTNDHKNFNQLTNQLFNNHHNHQTQQHPKQHQQPVVLNVNTTTGAYHHHHQQLQPQNNHFNHNDSSSSSSYQNGSIQSIPIRIPLSFSLQQLKSGQIALVPNNACTNNNLTNNNSSSSSATVAINTSSSSSTAAAAVINNHSDNDGTIITSSIQLDKDHSLKVDHNQHLLNSNNNDNIIQSNATTTNSNPNNNNLAYVPTNLNFILQGNQVFTPSKIG